SHEMRTPLTVISVNIQTAAEILEDMDEAVKDAEAAELLQSAQQEIMRLARMVGGMLNLASMTENTEKQMVNLSTLLHNSAQMYSLHLKNRGNLLKLDIADGLAVFGNADLLAQVAANLLQNAAAYTEQGEITLRAEQTGHEVLVRVEDTGTGISPELLPHVFERGVSTSGTGFGLYLCRTVVESLGGRIWIESTQGSGTSVAYALPAYEGQFGGEDA
ncbi:MAG: sensor histidine kinase, partial [Porticoccaceae bacterium]